MKSLYLCVILSILLLCFTRDASAEVVTLTEGTFSDKIEEKDTVWFVQFCVPWCKYCKRLGSLWDDLGKSMEGEDEIEIGQVDCSTSKPLCTKVDIHSYPTFKLFYNGENLEKYNGTRDVDSLKAFVLDATDKVSTGQVESDRDL